MTTIKFIYTYIFSISTFYYVKDTKKENIFNAAEVKVEMPAGPFRPIDPIHYLVHK